MPTRGRPCGPVGGRESGGRGRLVGGLYLGGAVVHLTLALTSANSYGPFAEGALFTFVRTGWRDIFMANPTTWALVLAAGEAAIGTAILLGGVWSRLGYLAAIAFHLMLMLFGWGFWLWSLPALGVLILLARREWRSAAASQPADRSIRPLVTGTRDVRP